MTVPDYQSLMLPVLKLGAQSEINVREATDRIAKDLQLSEEDLKQRLPSGRQTTFANRVHWAKTYLVYAGLLTMTRRAHFKETQRGLEVLAANPTEINNELLSRFPEFIDFRSGRRNADGDGAPQPEDEASIASMEATRATPEELIDVAYSEITQELRKELLERILSASPAFFEKVVVDLLVAMGYGGSRPEAGRRVGQSGDGGIDGIINEDLLGLDVVYIQAKRYAPGNVVGSEKAREFAGLLMGRGASKGVFITTSHFAPSAKEFVARIPQKIILIDGEELTNLMVRFGVGVRTSRVVELKKIDLDYFDEDEGL